MQTECTTYPDWRDPDLGRKQHFLKNPNIVTVAYTLHTKLHNRMHVASQCVFRLCRRPGGRSLSGLTIPLRWTPFGIRAKSRSPDARRNSFAYDRTWRTKEASVADVQSTALTHESNVCFPFPRELRANHSSAAEALRQLYSPSAAKQRSNETLLHDVVLQGMSTRTRVISAAREPASMEAW